jgi:hypothetical protein
LPNNALNPAIESILQSGVLVGRVAELLSLTTSHAMKTSFRLRCGALAASVLLLGDAMGGLIAAQNTAPMKTRDFEFASGNKALSGFIDQPGDGQARALIVFIHGSGGTNIRKENRYFDLRRRFTLVAIAALVTWGAVWLSFGRNEWRLEKGRLVLQRRLIWLCLEPATSGSRVWSQCIFLLPAV